MTSINRVAVQSNAENPEIRERDSKRKAASMVEGLLVKELLKSSGAFKVGQSSGSHLYDDLIIEAAADAIAQTDVMGLQRVLLGKDADPSPQYSLAQGWPATPAPRTDVRFGEAAMWGMFSLDEVHGAPVDSIESLVVADGHTHITSGFGLRKDPFTGATSGHSGVDVAAPYGSPIVAAQGGRVTYAGEMSGYGNVIDIDHGNGVTTRYAHASSLSVQKGEWVESGQEVARVGSTGRSTGNHLHFEVRQNGQAVDPQKVFRSYLQNRSVRADE